MILKFKKMHPNAVLPVHKKKGDAGMDLTAVRVNENHSDNQVKHYYGLAVEIPEGYVGLMFPRSSVCNHNERMSNSVGVIDSGYRGEISAVFDAETIWHANYVEGERTAQLVVVPYLECETVFVDELSSTERGLNGYGHTGK